MNVRLHPHDKVPYKTLTIEQGATRTYLPRQDHPPSPTRNIHRLQHGPTFGSSCNGPTSHSQFQFFLPLFSSQSHPPTS
uniref:Uncharacterized protein n=1 Tax=Steinernema glaseri TaxID=37863 RepID=A0A1I8A0L5_9BILA